MSNNIIKKYEKTLEMVFSNIISDENTMYDNLNDALTILKLQKGNMDCYVLGKVPEEDIIIGLIDGNGEKSITQFTLDYLSDFSLIPFVPFRIKNYISTDKLLFNKHDIVKHYILLNPQYEIDALMVHGYKNENYIIDNKDKILNNLPFEKRMGSFSMALAMTKDAQQVESVNGVYEFVFNKASFGLDKVAGLFPFFCSLTKYCYNVKSYEELSNQIYSSEEPLLICFIETIKKYPSNVFSKMFVELINFLNQPELNPNINASDIVFGRTNPYYILINPHAYINIFKDIIEERENSRAQKIKDTYKG